MIGLGAGVSYPEWMLRGICAQTDPELFFADRGQDNRAAKRVCRGCPAVAECLEWALETDQRFGIWGATSERQRAAIRRSRRREAQVAA